MSMFIVTLNIKRNGTVLTIVDEVEAGSLETAAKVLADKVAEGDY